VKLRQGTGSCASTSAFCCSIFCGSAVRCVRLRLLRPPGSEFPRNSPEIPLVASMAIGYSSAHCGGIRSPPQSCRGSLAFRIAPVSACRTRKESRTMRLTLAILLGVLFVASQVVVAEEPPDSWLAQAKKIAAKEEAKTEGRRQRTGHPAPRQRPAPAPAHLGRRRRRTGRAHGLRRQPRASGTIIGTPAVSTTFIAWAPRTSGRRHHRNAVPADRTGLTPWTASTPATCRAWSRRSPAGP